MNLYPFLAAGAIAIVALAEVMISRQKAQMKKQFLEELDRKSAEDNQKAKEEEQEQEEKGKN